VYQFSSLLDNVKPAPLAAVVLFVVGHLLLKVWFFSTHYYTAVARPVAELTGGFVTPVSLAAVFQMALLVVGAMVLVGRLRWRDLGIHGRGFVNAVIVLLVVWGLIQLLVAANAFRDCCSLSVGPIAATGGPIAAGRLLDAFWGSGFIEEVMYRGFLLPQVYLIARAAGISASKALLLALIGTQIYFGLNHIPAATRMHMDFGRGAWYILHATLVGGLFAAMYLRTGNLFIAVGAHALVNNPAALFVTGVDPALLMLIAVSVLLLLWPTLHRLFDDVFTLAGGSSMLKAAGS